MWKWNWKKRVLALTLSASMAFASAAAAEEVVLPEEVSLEESSAAEDVFFEEPASIPEAEGGAVFAPDEETFEAEDFEVIALEETEEERPSVPEEVETEPETLREELLDLASEDAWKELIEEETEDVEEPDEAVAELVEEYYTAQQSGNAANARSAGKAVTSSNYTTYGAQLSGESRKIYNALVSAWVTKDGTGSVYYEFTKEIVINVSSEKTVQTALNNLAYQIQSAYDAFLYDYPDVFWLGDLIYQYSLGMTGNKITGVTITGQELYYGAKSEKKSFRNAVNAAVNTIKAGLPAGADRYDTVRAIHDYVCNAVTYEENVYAHSAGGLFLHSHRVVCEGYAKAFKILCNRFNIPCALIVGDAIADYGETPEPHMWNYVKMEDGKWYLVDPTWDDWDPHPVQDFYFLLGSASDGHLIPVAEERDIITQFSETDNTKSFAVPALSTTAYVHHRWKEVSRVASGCHTDGSIQYICTLHEGETKTERIPAAHSFTKYKSDNNASALQDGTKTAHCDRKCGAKNTVTDAGSKLKAFANLTASKVTLKKKQSTSAFRVTKMQKGDSVVSWTSSNKKVVQVTGKADGTCKLTAKSKTGTAKITIRFKSGLKKTFTVKVQKGKVKTTAISGVKKKVTLQKGETFTLTPQRAPFTSGEKVTYSSSNKKVATVSKKGKITAKKKGKAKITVKSGSVKVTCVVTVP